MPIRAKDIPLAVLALVAERPALVVAILVAATLALQSLGLVGPGDWWGDGLEVGR